MFIKIKITCCLIDKTVHIYEKQKDFKISRKCFVSYAIALKNKSSTKNAKRDEKRLRKSFSSKHQ